MRVIEAGIILGLCVSLAIAESIGLRDFVNKALEGNPTIGIARERVKEAEALLKQANSAFLPHLSISQTYSRTDNPTQAFYYVLSQRKLDMASMDFNNPDVTDNFHTSIDLVQSLYAGGSNVARRRAAEFMQSSNRRELDSTREIICKEVAKAYFTFLRAEEFVKVQEEALQQVESELRVVEERYKQGAVVKSDLLNMEVRKSEVEEALISAKNAREIAREALYRIVGQRLEGEIREEEIEFPQLENAELESI